MSMTLPETTEHESSPQLDSPTPEQRSRRIWKKSRRYSTYVNNKIHFFHSFISGLLCAKHASFQYHTSRLSQSRDHSGSNHIRYSGFQRRGWETNREGLARKPISNPSVDWGCFVFNRSFHSTFLWQIRLNRVASSYSPHRNGSYFSWLSERLTSCTQNRQIGSSNVARSQENPPFDWEPELQLCSASPDCVLHTPPMVRAEPTPERFRLPHWMSSPLPVEAGVPVIPLIGTTTSRQVILWLLVDSRSQSGYIYLTRCELSRILI